MGIIGRAAIRNAQRVLEQEKLTLLSFQPLPELQSVWLEGARGALPFSDEPFRTGEERHTVESLRIGKVSVGAREISVGVDGDRVAKFLYTGTRAHRIPVSGTAIPRLHFFWKKMGYQEVWFNAVNHPGTAANEWRVLARTIAKPGIVALARLGLEAWVTRLRGRLAL